MKKFEIIDTNDIKDVKVQKYNKEKQRCFKLCYKINKANPLGAKKDRLINKLFNKDLKSKVEFRTPIYIDQAENMDFGKGIFINRNFTCMCRAKVMIEDDVCIGPNVSILTANHDFINHKIIKYAQIKICKNVWIGANVTILPGVTIGENSVVGAGSVVTKDVQPFTVVAGNPAKFIKNV